MKPKRYRIRGVMDGKRAVWWDGAEWSALAREAKTWASTSGARAAMKSLAKRGEVLPGDRIEVAP